MGRQAAKIMFSIGQVEELTGVKAHVLRYWETVIPGFAPSKDIGGRRIYTEREVELIMRLKYLVQEKKYTIEGARDKIIEDSDAVNSQAELMKEIHDLRHELMDLYFYVKNNAK